MFTMHLRLPELDVSLGEPRAEVARLAAGAAWNLQQWGEMETYVDAMRPDSVETAFYKAVMATHEVRMNFLLLIWFFSFYFSFSSFFFFCFFFGF